MPPWTASSFAISVVNDVGTRRSGASRATFAGRAFRTRSVENSAVPARNSAGITWMRIGEYPKIAMAIAVQTLSLKR